MLLTAKGKLLNGWCKINITKSYKDNYKDTTKNELTIHGG